MSGIARSPSHQELFILSRGSRLYASHSRRTPRVLMSPTPLEPFHRYAHSPGAPCPDSGTWVRRIWVTRRNRFSAWVQGRRPVLYQPRPNRGPRRAFFARRGGGGLGKGARKILGAESPTYRLWVRPNGRLISQHGCGCTAHKWIYPINPFLA